MIKDRLPLDGLSPGSKESGRLWKPGATPKTPFRVGLPDDDAPSTIPAVDPWRVCLPSSSVGKGGSQPPALLQDYITEFGIPLNIPVASEAPAKATVRITALPTNGTVVLADGRTAVTVGQDLTSAQVAGLRFKPGGAAISSQLDYDVIAAGASVTHWTISLPFDPATKTIIPGTPVDPPSDPAQAGANATPSAAVTPAMAAVSTPSGTASATANLAISPAASALSSTAAANSPGSYNAVFGTPLNIWVQSEEASPAQYRITTLPTNGTVLLPDGKTPVSVGQILTPAQAGGLRVKATGAASTSKLTFDEVVPGLSTKARTINLPLNSASNSITPVETTAGATAGGTGLTPTNSVASSNSRPTDNAVATPAAAVAAPSNPNPIVLENEKPGTPQSVWEIAPGQDSTKIQGFTTSISTALGGTVQFKVNNQTSSGTYQIQIYRLGYYGGNGATLVTTLNHSGSPVVQPNPLTNAATGLVDAGNWSVTDSWAVPTDATSGVYVANVVDGSQVFQIPFVVTDPNSTSDIVFQTSDETWQAYNGWGGNSLYGGNGPSTGTPGAAYAVSYNRPIVTRDSIGTYAGPQDSLFGAEYSSIYWLEENGYNVSYISGLDTATNAALLLNHKVFMDSGHDEYWTDSQVANVEAAENAGVNLAFLSGNEVFWQTRLSPSIDSSADPNRTLVSYKDTHANQEIDPSGTATGTFQDPRFGTPPQPSNELTGTLFQVDQTNINAAITIPYGETNLRFWRNTSVAQTAVGQTASLESSLLGYEWDSSPDNGYQPAGTVDLSTTTVAQDTAYNTNWGSTDTSGTATNNLVEYRDPTSGALVFGAGTVFWSWGLSNQHDNSPSPFSSNTADPNVQQATVNMLADMGVQPQTLQASLVIASQSTDRTAPTSTVSAVSSSSIVEGQTVTVTGTATDTGGGVAGGVEVSTDSGKTWSPASGQVGSTTMNWSYSFVAPATGTYKIETRAVDDSLNLESPAGGVSYTVSPSTALSLFSATGTAPIANDPNAIEVGVKFTSATSGLITGIRFYKGSANTGTHVGNLWSASGTLLATATFTNETASGWQQVNFATPVRVTPGTAYVASYHTNTGDYADTPYYFATYQGQTVGSLNAPGNSLNGVFAYSAGSTFPNQTSNDSADNYWVDVVFDDSGRLPPVLGNVAASAAYAAGGAATTVSSGTSVSDPSSTTLASGSVSITSGLLAGDTLAASTAGTSVTASYNASAGVLSLTGSDTLAHYQQVLDSVTYSSTSQNPTSSGADASRTVSWTVNDGTVASQAQTTALNITGGPATTTLFSASATPGTITENDPNAVDLGVKFQASTSGTIVGIRFYKGPLNTGIHIGDLWSSSGTLLASATFTNETASGWQQVNFSAPVSITAGTTYIASYETTSGDYSADTNYFANAVTNGPLTAPSDSASGGNGVYAYGSSNPFPNNTYGASNYWVDVVFSSSGGHAPPVLGNVAASAAYAAGGAATTVSSGTSVSDPSSTTLASGSVSITSGLLAGDTLAASTAGTSVTASYNASAGVLSLTGSDTLAHYQQVLDSVTYSSTSQNPTSSGADASRTVSWTVNDGTVASQAQTTALNITGGPATTTLFSASATPGTITENDPNAVDLGVKFQASTSGTIVGIRFYKGPLNTGAHIGDLWSSSGTLLASATFTNETASGWQQVNFSAPVSITAGTTYIASYETTSGDYSADTNYFANAVTNGPLTAPSDSASGGNGVYAYGSSNPFPNNTYGASNYWVDVVFSSSGGHAPPVLGNVAASAAYAAGGAATTVSSGTSVSDPSSTTLASGSVSITSGLLAGDTLAASTAGTSVTASYNASAGVLSLTGSDTLAHYQQVLDSVTYSSTSQNPTSSGADASRTVSWTVNDGTVASQAQTTALNITGGPPPVGPTGFAFAPATSSLQALQGGGSNLAANTPIGTFTQTGGVAGDSFTYKVTGSTGFIISSSGNTGTLSTGSSAVKAGTAAALSIQATDTTNGASSNPLPFEIVIGSSGADTINPTTLGIAASTPTILYGLAGKDTISAANMTGPTWLVGGAAADTLTGGLGPNTYLYAAAGNSTPSGFDVITNFNQNADKIDLRGISSTPLSFISSQVSSTVAARSIGWNESGGNTFIYVNTSAATEAFSAANMEMKLNGTIPLAAANLLHN